MKRIVVHWEIKANRLMNSVSMEAIVMGNIHNEKTSHILLQETLEYITIAETNGGKLIPLYKRPLKIEKEYSFFEVVFKNNRDMENFLKTI